jgi:hypothetical protein
MVYFIVLYDIVFLVFSVVMYILSAEFSERTAVKRWSNSLKDVSTILGSMIHKKTLQN